LADKSCLKNVQNSLETILETILGSLKNRLKNLAKNAVKKNLFFSFSFLFLSFCFGFVACVRLEALPASGVELRVGISRFRT